MGVITTPCIDCGKDSLRGRCTECVEKVQRWKPQPKDSPYRSAAWKKLSAAVRKRDGYRCQRRGCGAGKGVRLVVHHLDPVAEGHPVLCPMHRLVTVCLPCHNAIEAAARTPRQQLAQARRSPRIRPSRIPVTIVCGAPGSGKSTYVREHAGPRDLVIDLDAIKAKVSGALMFHVPDEFVGAALDERNRLLASLAEDTEHERAFFIVCAPEPSEREEWARKLGGEVVVMDTPLDECIRRIEADTHRPDAQTRIGVARNWWASNS